MLASLALQFATATANLASQNAFFLKFRPGDGAFVVLLVDC
jgi:hypothetical protein